MKPAKFRKELKKIMPGYKWTVHRSRYPWELINATGIITSGFNKTSTLLVAKRKIDDKITYEARSPGFGKNAQWLSVNRDKTLARALRGLQVYLESMANNYIKHASNLQGGRKC